jgi:hypothetical protein
MGKLKYQKLPDRGEEMDNSIKNMIIKCSTL